jgi:hypothetical protein
VRLPELGVETAALPLPRRRAHRSHPNGHYGARFDEPRTPGEREETKTNSMRCISRPEKARCGTRHGRPRRGLAGARENGPRDHHLAREMDGEKEERDAKLTER